ncbi:MAG TPA: hypothetical protein VEX15_06575 [Nocardioidaceae bacterium]|nr:hypothetical protein [Nocardioidaceae bacterium]
MAGSVVLLASGCGDDGGGSDPLRDAVSDKRAPDVTVTVHEDDGEPVVDITYDVPTPTDPGSRPHGMRGTYAFLQTLDGGTWSTAYTLEDGGEIIEGVPESSEDDAHLGPGPDTYRLPDLDADDRYRICVEFIVGHPARSAYGCSAPFHGD